MVVGWHASEVKRTIWPSSLCCPPPVTSSSSAGRPGHQRHWPRQRVNDVKANILAWHMLVNQKKWLGVRWCGESMLGISGKFKLNENYLYTPGEGTCKLFEKWWHVTPKSIDIDQFEKTVGWPVGKYKCRVDDDSLEYLGGNYVMSAWTVSAACIL